MTRFLTALLLSLATLPLAAQEGGLPTQALVRADSKSGVVPTAAAITVEVNSHKTPLLSLTPVAPSGTQVALLIDDGLSRSAGVQLNDLKAFITALPPATELLVGYMTHGSIQVESAFTTNHAASAAAIRLPLGSPGMSGSPYFCLSDFAKHWPGVPADDDSPRAAKARFVMMITNGVDVYNGSTALDNQNSPYVDAAVADAQRSGISVSSIYYRDAGFRGGGASLSGQSYLQQVAQGTGGESYYQGSGDPVSLSPFLTKFSKAISETYIATFNADATAGGHERLVRLKMSSSVPKLKLRHPDEVRPGNHESATAN